MLVKPMPEAGGLSAASPLPLPLVRTRCASQLAAPDSTPLPLPPPCCPAAAPASAASAPSLEPLAACCSCPKSSACEIQRRLEVCIRNLLVSCLVRNLGIAAMHRALQGGPHPQRSQAQVVAGRDARVRLHKVKVISLDEHSARHLQPPQLLL